MSIKPRTNIRLAAEELRKNRAGPVEECESERLVAGKGYDGLWGNP
jgi:hypothetical protein